MQAIQTRYFGPTNARNARIRARCAADTLTIEYDHALNVENNHAAAARALLMKLGWTRETHGAMYGGQLDDGSYAWVLESKFSPYTFAPAVKQS